MRLIVSILIMCSMSSPNTILVNGAGLFGLIGFDSTRLGATRLGPLGGRYDSTGRTSEVSLDDIGEGMEWSTYFEQVFTKVDKRMLDEDRVRYQGEPSMCG